MSAEKNVLPGGGARSGGRRLLLAGAGFAFLAPAALALSQPGEPPSSAPMGAPATAAGDTPGSPRPASRRAVRFELASNGLPTSGSEGMWKSDPVLADINGNGIADLAALPRLAKGARVWTGDGEGNWTDSSKGLTVPRTSCGGGLAVGDVNGDGKPDLVVGDHCTGIWVYLGDGAGTWTEVTAALYPADLVEKPGDELSEKLVTGAEDIAIGDVNGDGHLDILSGGSDEGGLNIFLNDGTGRNWTRQASSLISRGWANRVMLVDIDGDGRLDVVASHSDGPLVYLNDGRGDWFWSASGLPTPMMQGLYHGLATGDMDGDGKLDIVVANWVDGPEVYFQREHGTWQKAPEVFPEMFGGAVGLAVADVDGDGRLDIAVSGRLQPTGGMVRGLFLLLNEGNGTWRWARDTGLPSTGLMQTSGLSFGDIDGDGVPDLAVGSGLITETGPPGASREPVIAHRLMVWRGSRTAAPEDESVAAPGAASVDRGGNGEKKQ